MTPLPKWTLECMVKVKVLFQLFNKSKLRSGPKTSLEPKIFSIYSRDVEAVEYFLFPLPAPYKLSRFRVCFRFQLLSSKCFRFYKNLNASIFQIHAPCCIKNVSASGSSKSQMLPSSLPASSKCFRILDF